MLNRYRRFGVFERIVGLLTPGGVDDPGSAEVGFALYLRLSTRAASSQQQKADCESCLHRSDDDGEACKV